MFRSLVAHLQPVGRAAVQITHGRQMQGEFFRRLEAIDAPAAAALHGARSELRSYTLSQIQGNFQPRQGQLHTQPAEHYWFRVTGIDALAHSAMDVLSERCSVWEVAGSRFQITGWEAVPSHDNSWAGELPMEHLLAVAHESMLTEPESISLEFFSPTTFAQDKSAAWRRSRPLPDPPLVFRHIANHLDRAGATVGRPENWEDLLENALRLQRFSIETQRRMFGNGSNYTGFTGICEFGIRPDLEPSDRLWLHMLAAVAFYTGVGEATAWGMGQVRRVPLARFHYRGI